MQMATVMMSTTMKPAFLMEAIVVDLMPIHNTAQNVNALNEGKARIQYRNNIILTLLDLTHEQVVHGSID